MNRPPNEKDLIAAGINPAQVREGVPVCRNCLLASQIMRRLGFRDSISWGQLEGAPTMRLHATHSNALHPHTRVETEDEYKRRLLQRMGETNDQYAARVAQEPPFGHVTISVKVPQPLCIFHSSEITWLQVGRPRRLTVYMAHPVSGPDFAENVSDATCFLRFLRRIPVSTLQEIVGVEFEQKPLILAPWLAAIEEDESYPGGREAIIQDSRDAAMMFDEVWCLGGRISPGMLVESAAGALVRDLTYLGTWSKFRPPTKTSRASLKPRSRQ